MAFVNELISEEDKKNIDWTVLKAWPFSQPFTPTRWTIDHERNVFFVFLDGTGRERERPEVYALNIDGIIIRIEVEIFSKGTPFIGSDVSWNIHKIDIPLQFIDRHDEFIYILKEAIHAHGALYRINPVNSVQIDFSNYSEKLARLSPNIE